MTAEMLTQLINEFRQLQIEVAELKAAREPVQVVDDDEGSIRYQLYYKDGYEHQAKHLLAEGLATFLE